MSINKKFVQNIENFEDKVIEKFCDEGEEDRLSINFYLKITCFNVYCYFLFEENVFLL